MSTLLPLLNEEKSHLKRLNDNKPLVFALKKLFLNVCTTKPASNEAIEKMTQAFRELESIGPEDKSTEERINMV